MSEKVLLFTSDFEPRQGGVARYYGSLRKGWGEKFQVATSVFGPSEIGVYRLSWAWPVWPRWIPLLWLIPKYKFMTGVQLLAAGELLPIGTAMLFSHFAFGWKYFVFVHGLDVQLAQRNIWKRWLARCVLRHASFVVVNSNYTAELAKEAGAEPTTVVVAYPCPTLARAEPDVVNELRKHHRLNGRNIILTVARLVERKGVADVLLALPHVVSKVPNVLYVIVGDGPERITLEAKAREQNLPVLFTGGVTDAELSAWYELCDVFVLTPIVSQVDVEGFGIVYLEAQAAGKAVVGSMAGGVPEAIGEAGVCVKTEVELVRALTDILTQVGLRTSLGEMGRARVARDFTQSKQVEKIKAAVANMC